MEKEIQAAVQLLLDNPGQITSPQLGQLISDSLVASEFLDGEHAVELHPLLAEVDGCLAAQAEIQIQGHDADDDRCARAMFSQLRADVSKALLGWTRQCRSSFLGFSR